MASLAARSASAGPPTYCATRARAAAYTSSASTTSSTRPIAQRLVGGDEPPGEDQVLGLGRPDQRAEALGAAGAGDEAEQDLGLAELAFLAATRKSQVMAQLAAAARGRSR